MTETVRLLELSAMQIKVQNVVDNIEYGVEVDALLNGAVKVDMVKRSVRKYLGSVLSGQEIHDTQWRRGTTFRSVRKPSWTLVLDSDGRLYAPAASFHYEFAELLAPGVTDFEIVYLP